MGLNGSTTKKVSFGLDEDEKVTVLQGVKLTRDVRRRMGESQDCGSLKTPPAQSQHDKASTSSPKPAGPSLTEIQEEMRKRFEQEQVLVQEQLTKLAQKERERERMAQSQDLGDLTPELLIERGKAHEELEKAKILAKQLERKQREMASIADFYKEQLEILENKNHENYKQTSEQYSMAASRAEARVRARPTTPLCTELQAQVLQCYRDNPGQTLLCSGLAKQYMHCIQQARKIQTS